MTLFNLELFKKCKHNWKHFDTELRVNRKCSKCGISISYNSEMGQQLHNEHVNTLVEFIKTPEGQKQYENSRLKRYVDELEGILDEKR